MSCIRSQQLMSMVGMTPVLAWHMGERILVAGPTAHLTQLRWPNVVKPDHSLLKAE